MNAEVVVMQPKPDPETVLEAVRAAMVARGMSQVQVAREAGVSASSLTQLLGGTYNANPRQLCTKLERWLAGLRERATQPAMPSAPEWVGTPSAERVLAALTYAQLAGDVAVVYGGAGVGKSTAARECQRRYPNVWLATMSPATAGVAPALEEVCLALGMRELPGGGARMLREICQRVRNTGGLLVVDEAQHLSVPALDALRSIHDATGIGLALMGNELIYARMTGGTRAAWLDRLFSRIGRRLRLTRSTKEDVVRLAAEYGVTEAETVRRLVSIGSQAGALRGVSKCLRLAQMMAAGAQEALGARHVDAAWRDLTGEVLG